MARSGQTYNFGSIGYHNFEKFAVGVLSEIYKVPFFIFAQGKDGGIDASAKRVNIDLGRGKVLENQNVIVQVKHTKVPVTLQDGTMKSVFEKEESKVKELVDKKKLDIYIIATNYKLPAGQSDKLEKLFKDAGAKEVVVAGYEKLSEWVDHSPKLQVQLLGLYKHCNLTHLIDCPKAVQSIQRLKRYREDLEKSSIVNVKAFTKAKEIVESGKSLVFITGVTRSGKTTVAKKLVVELVDDNDKFTYYEIKYPEDFDKYWISGEKYIFFIDSIDSDDVKKWSKQKDNLKYAIDDGSKFVFAGESSVFNQTDVKGDFYDRLCNAVVDLSDEQFKE